MTKNQNTQPNNKKPVTVKATTKKPIKETKIKKEKTEVDVNYVQVESSGVNLPYTVSSTNNHSNGYIYSPNQLTENNIEFNNHINLGENEGNSGYIESTPTTIEKKLDELIDLLKHLIVETTPVEAILETTTTQTLQQLSFTDLYNIKEGLAHTIGVNNYASGDSWAQRTKHTATMRFTSVEKEIERRLSEINW